MNNSEFKIFTPKEYMKITPNVIVVSLFFPSALVLFFLQEHSLPDLLIGLCQIALFSSIGLALYFTFTKNFRIKPLNGTLEKALIFEHHLISIDGINYPLDQIEKIDFSIEDYYDKWEYKRDFNPCRSNGVDNWLVLKLKNNERIELCFQLMYKGQMKKLREQLIEYHRAGILHFLKLIDLLEISDYDEIQKFKKIL